MIFQDFRDRLRTIFGNESPSTEVSNIIRDCINRAYLECVRVADTAHWLRRAWSFVTVPTDSGTATAGQGVTATGGSRTLTFGASKRFDRRAIGHMIRINDQSESYLITDVTATTTVIVDTPYSNTMPGTADTANLAWDTLGFQYRLPPTFIAAYSVRQSASPLRLWGGYPRDLDREVPDPTITGATGNPTTYYIQSSASLPDLWSSKVQAQLGGTSGNVSVSAGSRVVTDGTTTADLLNAVTCTDSTSSTTAAATSLFVGNFIRFGSDFRWYRIQSVTNTPTLILDEPYQDTSQSNVTFEIGPGNAPWMRVYPFPTTRTHIDIEYTGEPSPLQAAFDEPVLPRPLHPVIMDGAIMYLAQYMRDHALESQKKDDFNTGLDQVRKAQNPSSDHVRRFRLSPTLDRSQYVDVVGTWPTMIETS